MKLLKTLLLIVLLVGVIIAFIAALVWVSQNASPTIDLAKVSSLTQPLQHIATVLALVAAGYWFILRRRAAVRLDVSQDIVVVKFGDEDKVPKFIYARVVITVTNKGEVPFRLGKGFARISQIKPFPDEMLNKLSKEPIYDPQKRTAIEWPFFTQPDGARDQKLRGGRELNVADGLKTVDPGLTEEIYVDFILPFDIKIVEVYSYVENKNHKLGWMRKSIHNVETDLMI